MPRMPCKELMKLSRAEVKAFIDSFDVVMTDCDGVLWNGQDPVKGSPEVIQKLRQIGKKVFFCTNNSTKTRSEYVKKVDQLGFGGQKDEIMGTSFLAANYLKDIGYKGKVYVIGSTGITGELDEAGIPHTGISRDDVPDNYTHASCVKLLESLDPDIKCVLCGFDFYINYIKIAKAAYILNQPDSIFIGTNTDEQFPCKNGMILPGTGAAVQSVATAACREPIVMGKPNRAMYEAVRKLHPGIDPKRTVMIGDRANTDILFGKNCDLITLMVGTGVHSLDNVREWEKSGDAEEQRLCADFYLPSLGDLLAYID